MTKGKLSVYVNRFNGNILTLTKGQAKKRLNEDWSKAEQIVNAQGERGMRLQLEGATVDILENNTPDQPAEVVTDGKSDAE